MLALPALWLACTPEPYPYEVYATVDHDRPANPAVDAAGNVYITIHPLDAPTVHLMRIDTTGEIAPYPTAQWAASPDSTGRGIANSIGIQATEEGLLYVLDWGNAGHGPKVLVWNTQQNQLHRVYNLPAHAHHSNSFLQDFAVDTERQFLYMADMGRGDLVGEQAPAIVALNLNTGEARRILENHESFLPGEGGFKVNGNQMMLKTDEGDKPLNLGLNPICIDPANEWVYYSTVNPGTVYRIPANLLADFEASEASIADAIEAYGP
ncbi:MAG: L-dopachrome tautomerase-related protein, partial [Bacteroidota bacterium]